MAVDRETALAGIQEVLRDVLGDDDIAVDYATTAETVDGWDSMAHINIVIATEKRFAVHFKAADLAALRGEGATVGRLVDLVVANG